MATQILKVPRHVEGCVVECGSFKGGSAANLSLICALCDRRLEIFDSFAGLPEPSASDRLHTVIDQKEVQTYAKGAFLGTLDEVRANIARCGRLELCNFHVGNFEQTLPSFNDKCILAFLDVDLVDSARTCLIFLWPLLQDGCLLYSHEARHMEIVRQFFDDSWWQAQLQCNAPGLIGAGTGLGLLPFPGGFRSSLGYVLKNPSLEKFVTRPQLDEDVH